MWFTGRRARLLRLGQAPRDALRDLLPEAQPVSGKPPGGCQDELVRPNEQLGLAGVSITALQAFAKN